MRVFGEKDIFSGRGDAPFAKEKKKPAGKDP